MIMNWLRRLAVIYHALMIVVVLARAVMLKSPAEVEAVVLGGGSSICLAALLTRSVLTKAGAVLISLVFVPGWVGDWPHLSTLGLTFFTSMPVTVSGIIGYLITIIAMWYRREARPPPFPAPPHPPIDSA